MTLAIDRSQASQGDVKTRALSNAKRSILTEKTSDSSLEAGVLILHRTGDRLSATDPGPSVPNVGGPGTKKGGRS